MKRETKWKKGDRVRVRLDLSEDKRYSMEGSNNTARPTYTMVKYFKGSEMTVSDASPLGYYMEETGQDFLWTDGMLEEALPNVGISIIREGRAIIAEDVFTGEKAVAKCHPDDKFDARIGATIAFNRLVGMPDINGTEMMDELDKATGHILNVYLKLKKGEEKWKSKR